MLAITNFTKRQLKIITNYQNISRSDFIKMLIVRYSNARIVVKSLRLNQDTVAVFEPNSTVFLFLPGQIVDFGIKIQC